MTYAHKCQIQQQQEARLSAVMKDWQENDLKLLDLAGARASECNKSFKQHMIRNGYKPLPRNKYEDLIITMPASYVFLSIQSK